MSSTFSINEPNILHVYFCVADPKSNYNFDDFDFCTCKSRRKELSIEQNAVILASERA